MVYYIAHGTFEEERTMHMSLRGASKGLAYVMGPVLQLTFTLLQCSSNDPDSSYLSLDMYTSVG